MATAKFGARIPASGPTASVARIIESTQESEALGYDSVWIMDHVHNSHARHKQYPVGMGSYKDPSNTLDPHQFETIAVLSFLAGATNRVRLGVGIMAVPLREPVVLAKEIASLDALSGGRFIWGVGVSNVSDKEEYRAVGKPFAPYAERYELMGECVGAARAIWENPSASYHGKYVNFDDLVIYPKPAGRVPVWIGCYTLAGGVERPAVRFTLDHADGWIYGFMQMPHHLRTIREDFEKTAAQEGRDLTGFDWCFQLRMSIGETEEEARQNVAWVVADQPEMAKYAGYMWKKQDDWRDVTGAEDAPKSNLDTAVIGTPDDVRERVRQYIDAGATYFDLWFIYPNFPSLMKQIRLFAKEVMPAFEEAKVAVG